MPFITAATLLRTCIRICIVILGSWASKGSLVCSPIHQTPCANGIPPFSHDYEGKYSIDNAYELTFMHTARGKWNRYPTRGQKKSRLRSVDNQFDNGALQDCNVNNRETK